MTKKEAIEMMKKGIKITHRYFSPEEWMYMKNGMIVLEDGVTCTPEEFWKWRENEEWDDNYFEFE